MEGQGGHDVIRGRGHSAHAVRRCALVVFADPLRQVVTRVVATFEDAGSAESFAADQGWTDFAIAPASLVLPVDPAGAVR